MKWFTPDSYPADWYGYGKNQVAHWAIGIGATAFTGILWQHYWGEYPQQWVLFSTVFCVFLLSELAQPENKLWDAVEDLVFRAYGAFQIAFGLHEQERFDPGLDPDPTLLLSTLALFLIHLGFGSGIRWMAKRRTTKNDDA